MKLPLHPKHAEEEKKFFFYICQRIIGCYSAGGSCLFSIMKIPFHSDYVEEEEYFSSSVNGEANIGVGKAFLMKHPFHSENVEEEEYLFLLYD